MGVEREMSVSEPKAAKSCRKGSEGSSVTSSYQSKTACLKQAVQVSHTKAYPAFSIAGSDTSRRSTISLVTSNSFTRFWLGR